MRRHYDAAAGVRPELENEDAYWDGQRKLGVLARKQFASAVDHIGLIDAIPFLTDLLYSELFGAPAGTLKRWKNVPSKRNLRDYLDLVELRSLAYAERLIAQEILVKQLNEIDQCAEACIRYGRLAKERLVQWRSRRSS